MSESEAAETAIVARSAVSVESAEAGSAMSAESHEATPHIKQLRHPTSYNLPP